jgi:hypothetical protein
MPSALKRWNGTAWIDVADFDDMVSGTAWKRPLTTPKLGDLYKPGLSMDQNLKDIHYRPPGAEPTDAYMNVAAGYASTPDNALWTVTGSFNITAKVVLPGPTGANRFLVAQWPTSPQADQSILLFITTAGIMQMTLRNSDVTQRIANILTAAEVNAFGPGPVYIGVRCQSSTGRFAALTSTDGVNWVETGTPVTTATWTSTSNSASPLHIGSRSVTGTDRYNNRVHWAELRTGLNPGAGTLRWRFDATEAPPGATSYIDPRGVPWDLSSTTAIVNPPIGNWSDWNSAWGIVSRGTFYSLPGTINPLHPASTTYDDYAFTYFTPVAGRRYKFDLYIRAVCSQNSQDAFAGNFQLRRNNVVFLGSGHDPWKRGKPLPPPGHPLTDSGWKWASWRITWVCTYYVMGSGNAMFNVQFNNQASNTQTWVDGPSFFVIRDEGPNRGDAV